MIVALLVVVVAGLAAGWVRLGQMLPSPAGLFPVGVTAWTRPSADDPSSSDACPITTRLWYPAAAEPRLGQRTRYDPSAKLFSVRRWATIPAVTDALLAAEPRRLPALVFFPGWAGGLNDNTALVEDLASRGFVVLAIGYDNGLCAGLAADERADLDLTTEQSFVNTQSLAHTRLRRVAHAASRVLDDLAELDRSDPSGRFAGRLDLSRIAVVGHSFGGAMAVSLCAQDPRLSAAINIDGWLFGAGADSWISQPLLVLGDGGTPTTRDALQSPDPVTRHMAILDFSDQPRIDGVISAGRAIQIVLEGTQHDYFSDFPYLGRHALLRLQPAGDRAIGRAADYITAFLTQIWSGRMPSHMAEPPRGVSLVQSWTNAQLAPMAQDKP